jgi:DNA topoisomerase-1
LSQPSGDRALGVDPETGHEIVVRNGRYGPFVSEVVDEDSKEKARTGSLLSSMSPETVTLEDALKLLALPRLVGKAPDGEEVLARTGRYGPYIQKEKETRSLESDEQVFEITLDEALALLAQPKARGRRAAKPPLRELGEDPSSKKPVVLKEGRFGPYVTDGETNASLRAGDSVDEVTIERASELLAERRSKGPSKRRPAKRKKS